MKIQLIQTKCERCHKPIYTTSRSVLGLDALKKKTPILCEACTTPEEKETINRSIGEALVNP